MKSEHRESGFLEVFTGIFEFFDEQSAENCGCIGEESSLDRLGPELNHPVWLVGHMTWLTDSLLAEIPFGKSFRNREWDRFFAAGSKKVEDKEYPRFAEVTERFASVKKSVAALLDDLKSADFDKACTALTDWFPTPLDSMLHFVKDANYHLGQLNYARRAGSAGGSSAE